MVRNVKNATLKDVAELAQVSTATVRRVMNQNGYVSADARDRVESAIQALSYRTNALAKGLRTQKTCTFGHLLTAIALNPFFAGVGLGVERAAMEAGYGVLIYNVQGDRLQERRGVEMFIERRVDAILFTTPIDAANVQLAVDAGVPVVQIERPTSVQTASVVVDNYAGSVLAVEHLIACGHRRIAYIGGLFDGLAASARYQVEAQRCAGYLDTMARYRLPVDDRLVALCDYYSLEEYHHAGEGYRATHAFLDAEQPPTAVFAASDLLAAGALQAIYERGLLVPNDIAVVGYDDTYAPYLSPPLTTVRQPMMDIGRAAIRMMLDAWKKDDAAAGAQVMRHETLLPDLVVRASTRRQAVNQG